MSKVDRNPDLVRTMLNMFEDAIGDSDPANLLDKSLLCLLLAHEKAISELISFDTSFEEFHKAFRQLDVVDIDQGQTDYTIWQLLGESRIFGEVYARALNYSKVEEQTK